MAARKATSKRTKSTNVSAWEPNKETFASGRKSRQLFSKRNVFIALGIVIIVGILYYFRGLFVVALVNGQPITRFEVIQELEKRGGEQTLSSLVTQALIVQEAGRQGVNVTEAEIDEEVKKLEDTLKQQGQNLDDALMFQGTTREKFREQIRVQKLVEKMLADEIKVTDKEITDYIQQNKDTIPATMSPSEVTSSAKQALEDQKMSVKVQEWLQKLQEAAQIQYFVNY
ncbi:MAG: hypothetical protein A2687_03300 [Candidatus Levybacteria bacterium RIFCSPHIGHO2_01_FULL_38_26]|nr:MAG: hypothetical protein A2687_03300 [Candidatus Levybacteria bacterium RIFCSPHIGHO2_01_FULL_38_26]